MCDKWNSKEKVEHRNQLKLTLKRENRLKRINKEEQKRWNWSSFSINIIYYCTACCLSLISRIICSRVSSKYSINYHWMKCEWR